MIKASPQTPTKSGRGQTKYAAQTLSRLRELNKLLLLRLQLESIRTFRLRFHSAALTASLTSCTWQRGEWVEHKRFRFVSHKPLSGLLLRCSAGLLVCWSGGPLLLAWLAAGLQLNWLPQCEINWAENYVARQSKPQLDATHLVSNTLPPLPTVPIVS